MNSRLPTVAAVITTLIAAAMLARGSDDGRDAWLGVPYDSVSDWKDLGRADSSGLAQPDLTVVVWADLLCPHCRRVHGVLKDFKLTHGRAVQVSHRHLTLTAASREFATAAECARPHALFAEFLDAVYGRQGRLDRLSAVDVAVDVGVVDVKGFVRCVDENDPFDRIQADIGQAVGLGITATPAILINDRLLRGTPGDERLTAFLDASLKSSRGSRIWSRVLALLSPSF